MTAIILIAAFIFIAVVLLLKPFTMNDTITTGRLKKVKTENDEESKQGFLTKLLNREKSSNGESAGKRFVERVDRIAREKQKNKPLTKSDPELKKLLAISNIDISPATFGLFRISLGVLFGLITYILLKILDIEQFNGLFILLASLAFGLLGTLIPMSVLRSTANNRREAILMSMTDTIDLLSLSVEAGLGYDAAILKIWERDKSPAMQELVRTLEDINHGIPTKTAYASLAARCDVDEMTMFANNMSQADILGISIVDVLKSQADTLRAARKRRAETAIQKAPVKLTFPLVFFIFPTILIVLLTPALLNIINYL